MKHCTVLLADDHDVVLEGLRRILDRPGFWIIGTVHDGLELLEAAAALTPDVIVVDVTMPLLNGIEAVRQLRRARCNSKIVFLTMHTEVSYATEALAAGGSAYVLKSSRGEELVAAIQEVLSGRTYVSGALEEPVRQAMQRLAHHRAGKGPGRVSEQDGLTPRRREILQLLAEGRHVKEIASLLHISPRTVEFHKYGLMETLGVRSVADLARYAARHGMVA
jgi:DNA-binding NarL/FixJ family response regulator